MEKFMKILQRFCFGALALAFAQNVLADINPVNSADALGSDLVFVMHDKGNDSVFLLDLGIRTMQFNPDAALRFDLGANAVFTEWLRDHSTATGMDFAVMGAKQSGNYATRVGLSTSFSIDGSAPGNTTNSSFQTITGNVGPSVLQAHQSLTTAPDRSAVTTHPTDLNGADYQTATAGGSSYANFAATWLATMGFKATLVGQNAEFFRITAGAGTLNARTNVEDFFAATETAANPGGFWAVSNNVLTYTGAPTVVAPVPEPSEWAMMLLGLGVVGGLARRRTQMNK
jgi:hypothetical protein